MIPSTLSIKPVDQIRAIENEINRLNESSESQNF